MKRENKPDPGLPGDERLIHKTIVIHKNRELILLLIKKKRHYNIQVVFSSLDDEGEIGRGSEKSRSANVY